MTVVVEVCQTTPTISPSRAVPNPKLLAEVAFGVALFCCRDTSLNRPPPHQSKSPDLRLVLETWKTNLHPLSKEGEVMEHEGGGLDHQTSYNHPRILNPMDEGRHHGSPWKDAWNDPIRET